MGATPWKFESSSGHQFLVESGMQVRNRKLKESSRKWLERQLSDPFVAEAKRLGYRSRAAFKILEIQEKFRVIRKDAVVVDLGAAPGGWSQVVAPIARRVVAVDLLDMSPLPGVEFIRGDFLEQSCAELLEQMLGGQTVDVVLSDMAPNTCGIHRIDHLRIMNLIEAVYAFCQTTLKPGGAIVAKVFQGGTEVGLLTELKHNFAKVSHFKPNSSRKSSPETYLIATGYVGKE